MSLLKCPGLYCGRTLEYGNNVNSSAISYSDCGACDWGYRANDSTWCEKCHDEPTFYDWLYLGFMALCSLVLHWFFIDYCDRRKNGRLVILHLSALCESVIAALCTLLIVEPLGSLRVTSCPVEGLSDWYTLLYNPSPDYMTVIHCTQEVVYPLYTMVMIYYAFSLILMLLIRPLVSSRLMGSQRGSRSIYAALYFLPILVVLQTVAGGLLYYAFPYIVIVVSVVTNAMHLASFNVQNAFPIIKANVTVIRNLSIILCHWGLHAYGIVALTLFSEPSVHGPLLCLVPLPTFFYLTTIHFTDPQNLDKVS